MKELIEKILKFPPITGIMIRFFARVNHLTYKLIGNLAVTHENGLHPKHRLTKYHDFFINNVSESDSVLDVGCGNGALLKDVVLKTKSIGVGVDISEHNVSTAKDKCAGLKHINIIHKDIFDYNGKNSFDVILLSNVLEHIQDRVELLRVLKKRFSPKKVILRVPMFERDWLVPYKKEIGIEWRLDNTHFVEYTEDMLKNEIKESGLEIETITSKWGEFWAVVVPPGRN
jgi:SAM-dependent methyltransferase